MSFSTHLEVPLQWQGCTQLALASSSSVAKQTQQCLCWDSLEGVSDTGLTLFVLWESLFSTVFIIIICYHLKTLHSCVKYFTGYIHRTLNLV